MKKVTQKQILLKLLRSEDRWFASWEIQTVATPFGWLGTSADRVARVLAETGEIERKHEKNVAFYKAKGPSKVEVFYVDGVEVSRKIIY